MSDNVNLTAGDGTIVAGTDTIGGVAYPRAKAVWGPDGTVNDTDVASGKPMPIQNRASGGTEIFTTSAPGSVKLTDGTNAVAVKAASTAPGATDPAIVVAISPNSVNANGSATSANSAPVVLASNQKFYANTYETIAAGVTAQVMGGSGATGDYISGILVIPATTSPGNVLLLDNATSITVFTGGSSSVSNLVPFWIQLGMVSASGAWKITTGSNVSAIGVGNFS